jgi:ATP-dependent Clp protease ATP-binding subunit ClpX
VTGAGLKQQRITMGREMTATLHPTDIYAYLSQKVLGQEEVLKQISVSVYKHIQGVKWGNILLIGNSGTGKTTIMNAVLEFYLDHRELADYQTMLVMNANTLTDESGEVHIHRIFKNLEADVRNRLGSDVSEQALKTQIENATVCLDEIDKISAKISGRVNVPGILIQQALLTVLEGETFYLETTISQDGKKQSIRIPINTAKMLFICGGAFEGLYDQVNYLVSSGKDGRVLKEKYIYDAASKNLTRSADFNLKEYMRINDLFDYGMVPQFISRFGAIAILENLGRDSLKKILINAADSPFVNAKIYFKTFGIDLEISEEALELIAGQAEKNTRIGARSLRESFNRIVSDFQFDPFGSDHIRQNGDQRVLVLDKDMLEPYMKTMGK